jgi:ADP-ribose 1''-phosphate phosphatase
MANRLTITESTGDLFASPENTILLHACNCIGSWGGGIATVFKKNYPEAFLVYKAHCDSHKIDELIGTAHLIPPSETKHGVPEHWIGCLFTSRRYGRAKDKKEDILQNTEKAMRHLMHLLEEHGLLNNELYMCRINGGLFNVPWKETRHVLESLKIEKEREVHVIRPAKEPM